MIYFDKNSINKITLTLTEKAILNSPNYLFVFKSRNSNDIIKFVVLNSADISTAKIRCNIFNINGASYFSNALVGEYTYEVYEQVSTTNTDISLTSGLLENGQMTLSDSSEFSFTTYQNQSNTFKVRDI